MRRLNRHRFNDDAADLPEAAEACFSIEQHLACVDRRIERLWRALPLESIGIDHDAAVFVMSELLPFWRRVRAWATIAARRAGVAIDQMLPAQDRRLSPSDFGFHNALLGSDGRLRFLDFEYAGWDDPAKLVCDFFCQPDLPVPMRYLESFTDRLVADLSDPPLHRLRIGLLLPVYRVKWACILLNEFLPEGASRRSFAGSNPRDVDKKRAQLDQARHVLDTVDDVRGFGL